MRLPPEKEDGADRGDRLSTPDPRAAGELTEGAGLGSPDEGTAVLLGSALRSMTVTAMTLFASFAFSIAVARALPPAERGHFALLQTLAGLVAVIANFAIAKGLIHALGRRLISPGAAIAAAVTLGVVSGAVGTVLFLPVIVLRGDTFPGLPAILLFASPVLATTLLLREYLSGVLVAGGRTIQVALATAIQPVASLAIVVPLIFLGHSTLRAVYLAWAGALFLSTLWAFAMASAHAGKWDMPSRHTLVSLARFGLRTYPALLLGFLNVRLDLVLVGLLNTAASVGHYAVAVNMAEVPLRIGTLLILASSGLVATRDRSASAALVSQVTRWMLVVMTGLVSLIAVAAPVAVPLLFGPLYRPVVSSLLLLLPGVVAFSGAAVIWEYFVVQRARLAKATLVTASSVVIGTLLNLALTPRFGAIGASLASSVSYLSMFLVAVALFTRDSGIAPIELVKVSRSDLQAITSAVLSMFRKAREGR